MDEQGKVIGSPDENPILNTLIYDVEFPDGNIKKYSANVIAVNVIVNCYSEGYYSSMMACILDHKRDGYALIITENIYQVPKWANETTPDYSWMEFPCDNEGWYRKLDTSDITERIKSCLHFRVCAGSKD